MGFIERETQKFPMDIIRIHPDLGDPRREITLPGSGGGIWREAEDPDAWSRQGDLPTGDTQGGVYSVYTVLTNLFFGINSEF